MEKSERWLQNLGSEICGYGQLSYNRAGTKACWGVTSLIMLASLQFDVRTACQQLISTSCFAHSMGYKTLAAGRVFHFLNIVSHYTQRITVAKISISLLHCVSHNTQRITVSKISISLSYTVCPISHSIGLFCTKYSEHYTNPSPATPS